MSKFVDPDLQSKLERALKTAVDHVQDGAPDYETAVFKAASEHNLNPQQTNRLCEHFNRARAIYQYGQEGDKRAAAHQVVQPAKVLERMCAPVAVGDKAAAYVDYSVYSSDPVEFQRLSKQAAAESTEPTQRFPAWGATTGSEVTRMQEMIDAKKYAAKRASDAAGMLRERGNRILDKMAQKLAATPADQAATTLAKLARLYGSKTASEFGMVTVLSNRLPRHIVHAVTREKLASVSVPVRLSAYEQDLYDTLKAVEADADKAAEYTQWAAGEKQAAEGYQTQLNAFFTPQPAEEAGFSGFFNKQAQALKPAKGNAQGNPQQAELERFRKMMQDEFKRQNKAQPKEPLGNVGTNFKSFLSDNLKRDNTPIVQKQKQEMDNVQRELLLEELLITDPILSDADEQRVIDAYETLTQVSPEVSGNKELTRSMLRQMIHADGMTPFDASQLADYDLTRSRLTQVQQDIASNRPERRGLSSYLLDSGAQSKSHSQSRK